MACPAHLRSLLWVSCLVVYGRGFVPLHGVHGTRGRARVAALSDWVTSSLDELSGASKLPLEQLLEFERKGHTIVRGLASKEEMASWGPLWMKAFKEEELEAYRHEVRVFFGDFAYEECDTMEKCLRILADKEEDDITPFLQVFNFWRRHESLRPFSLAKRFAYVAAQLLGVPKVRLYQDSVFMKRPGDGPTLWHTDLATAPFDSNAMITAWIPLVRVPSAEEGGSPLTFASGSHRDMSFSYWFDPHSEDDEDVLNGRYPLEDYGALMPGDATLHHGWTLHGSGPNTLSEARVAVSLAYVADGARTIPEESQFEPDDEDLISYEAWVQQVDKGAPVDHPLVPLVYP